ncbi:hypothetical protein RXV86_16690 [Alisedimentitalea sp. MJ-SS2]|nr:hypothetical protein [Alisedimentitalea sp. MJ-SS2]MDU8929033.1 hypothetical protein [Alisedimentitalea sp. MJ-SS2]
MLNNIGLPGLLLITGSGGGLDFGSVVLAHGFGSFNIAMMLMVAGVN